MSSDQMAQPAKFDFGTVFDRLVENDDGFGAGSEPYWTAPQVEAEKAAAFAEGRKAGRSDTLGGVEQRISATLEEVLAQTTETLNRLEAKEAELALEAKRLSIAVGRAIASELLVHSHRAAIEDIVSEALGFLTHQPHVVVRVHEDLLEGFKARFEEFAEARGFTGKLIMLGEPDIERTDCRIEWADGGIARDSAAMSCKIEEIVRRHLSPEDAACLQNDLFAHAAGTQHGANDVTEEASE